MKLPESINLRAIHAISEHPLADLVFGIRVRSGRKNDYHILFPKTDAKGDAFLSRDDFTGQFEDHWESGLMDYDGSISSANPVVSIYLFDVERYRAAAERVLAWPLLKNEKEKWKNREEKFHYLRSCRNADFQLTEVETNIETTSRIEIRIK